jgi:hypothetical protein
MLGTRGWPDDARTTIGAPFFNLPTLSLPERLGRLAGIPVKHRFITGYGNFRAGYGRLTAGYVKFR